MLYEILLENSSTQLDIQTESSNSILTDICYINDFGKGILHEGAVDIFTGIYNGIIQSIGKLFDFLFKIFRSLRKSYNYKFIRANKDKFLALDNELLSKYKVEFLENIYSPDYDSFMKEQQMFFTEAKGLLNTLNGMDDDKVDGLVSDFKSKWTTKKMVETMLPDTPLLKKGSKISFEKGVRIVSGVEFNKKQKELLVESVTLNKDIVRESIDYLVSINMVEADLYKTRKDIAKSLQGVNGYAYNFMSTIKQEGYSHYSINGKRVSNKLKSELESLILYVKTFATDSATAFYNLISAEIYIRRYQYQKSNDILYMLRVKEFKDTKK